VVSDPAGPYAGVNPPPNAGTGFNPPLSADASTTIPAGLIVRQNAAGQWMDDNNHNWTSVVNGPNAPLSGRPVGWTLTDHDCAVIDTATSAVTLRRHAHEHLHGHRRQPRDRAGTRGGDRGDQRGSV